MIKKLLSKYYSCDFVRDGKVVGSGVYRVWIWDSPIVAFEKMKSEDGVFHANFRRAR